MAARLKNSHETNLDFKNASFLVTLKLEKEIIEEIDALFDANQIFHAKTQQQLNNDASSDIGIEVVIF